MHDLLRPWAFTIALLPFLGNGLAAAEDPLRFIPEKTDLVVKIENPRQLVEIFSKLDALNEARQLDPVRQFLDTAQSRRFFEFIAYYERDLGAKWPELMDKLAGGGIAIGAKIVNGTDDPVLFVIQGTDEALMKKFVQKAGYVVEQELARSESKEKLTKELYKDFEVRRLGKDFNTCLIGSARLLFANKAEALRQGIDQHIENISRNGKPARNMLHSEGLAKAKKLLPSDPQVWLYYRLDYLKKLPYAEDVLTTPRNNTVLTFAFPGTDVVRLRRVPGARPIHECRRRETLPSFARGPRQHGRRC